MSVEPAIRELPTFVGQVQNQTVRAGNDVILSCQVKNLGSYKVSKFTTNKFIFRILGRETLEPILEIWRGGK